MDARATAGTPVGGYLRERETDRHREEEKEKEMQREKEGIEEEEHDEMYVRNEMNDTTISSLESPRMEARATAGTPVGGYLTHEKEREGEMREREKGEQKAGPNKNMNVVVGVFENNKSFHGLLRLLLPPPSHHHPTNRHPSVESRHAVSLPIPAFAVHQGSEQTNLQEEERQRKKENVKEKRKRKEAVNHSIKEATNRTTSKLSHTQEPNIILSDV